MKAVTKILAGAAGVAATIGMAAPASAQYYPQPYGGGNVLGQVLQQVLNPYGNQYAYGRMNPQMAVNQCTAAVQQRLAQRYNAAGYSPYGYNNAYGYNGYNQAYSNARVVAIRNVEQRSSTTVRVRGYATSGMNMGYGYQGYGYNPYQPAQAQADLSFKCDIDSRGYIRDIDIDRR